MESGRSEVYVLSYPGDEGRLQLSTNGGEAPAWTRDGEVLFLSGTSVLAATVSSRGGTLTASKPVELFQTGGTSGLAPVFDATADGKTLYMLRSRGQGRLSLVLNWPRELDRLQSPEAPGGRP